MLGPNQFRDMIEMIEHVLDRRRLIRFDEHPHPGDPHDAPRRGHLLDRLDKEYLSGLRWYREPKVPG